MTARRRITLTVLALLLAFWMFVAWSIPYNPIDDFQWGMEDGLRWWLGGLLNGRYVGNFFTVVMCRFPPVKTLTMGGGMFLIPVLTAVLAARGDETRFLSTLLLSNLCILLMPPIVWQEIYGWVSGFSIYGVSTLLFLTWLLVLRYRAEPGPDPAPRRRVWICALFLLTLALGMFVENLTLLLLGACLSLTIRTLRLRPSLSLFAACLLGAALAAAPMFCNGVVRELSGSGSAVNGLRTLIFSPGDSPAAVAAAVAGRYVKWVLPYGFLRGIHLALPLSLLTASALWNGPLRPLAPLGLLPLAFHRFLKALPFYWDAEPGPGWILVSALCWLLPVLALLVQREEWPLRRNLLMVYLAAPLSLLPLAPLNTIGHRLCFFPMVMLILAAAATAAPLLRPLPVICGTAAVLAALMVLWGGRNAASLACTQLREQLIREAARTGQKVLVLPTERSETAPGNVRDPENLEYASYFRRFYHISEDVTLVFPGEGSFEYWPDIPQELWDNRLVLPPSDDFTPSLP